MEATALFVIFKAVSAISHLFIFLSLSSYSCQNELAASANDPFAPGGTTVTTDSDPGKAAGWSLPVEAGGYCS